MHPKQSQHRSGMSRREFLRRTAMAGVAFPSAAAILAACGGGDGTGGGGGGGDEPLEIGLARPDAPVTLPIYEDLPPIEDGLPMEAGPLRIFNWNDYIYKKVIKNFTKEHGVEVEYIQFEDMTEAIQKIRSGAVEFDLFFPTIDQLGKLVAAKLLQPLNHSYLENFPANVWPDMESPFYDQESRYTVPYLLWKDGIGFRRDHVDDPGTLSNPYDVFWDASLKGKVGMLDEYRETPAMAMLRAGQADVNTEDPAVIDQARDDLIEAVRATNPQMAPGDYTRIAEGQNWVHWSWSGNISYTQWYLPEGVSTDVLGFWFPEDGSGLVNNDLIAISAGAQSPVLAHMFIDYLYDTDQSLLNYSYEGFQPPITPLDPSRAISDGYIPPSLENVIVRDVDIRNGYQVLELPPDADAMWQDAWALVKAGV